MSIDSLLYRPLIAKSQFEGLIPRYQGKETALDKSSDNSTTYDTLKFMSAWATKYAYQMNKVAPLLKGRTIQETVNNIYKFLYNHFQYKLDGSVQNLYSPSAAWHFRTQGFDCKTYSILASCILQNLNIKHSFRMVQQMGIMPGEWSHVYVVVPNGNTEYVIDATKHTNTEVSYTKKHDHIMIHKGLAAPAVGTLGCACSGKKIALGRGLGAPSTLSNTISNFHGFLNELEKNGISPVYTNRMLELVKANVQNGIDPNMQEIVQKAFANPAGQLGVSFGSYPVPSLNLGTSQGYSFTSNSPLTSTSVLTSGGATSSGGFMQSGFATGAVSALSNLNVKGINIGNTVTQLASGNFIGAGLSVLTNLIPMEKTFGAVFANGFDLSCWGSSYSEQKAKVDLEKRTPELIQESGITRVLDTNTLDRFLNLIDVEIFWSKNGQNPKYAKCTQKGHAMKEKAFQALMVNTLESIRQNGYQLIPNGKKPTTLTDNKISSYDSYIVVPPQQQQQQQQQQPQTPATNSDGTPVKSSSGVVPLLVGGAILAAKFLI